MSDTGAIRVVGTKELRRTLKRAGDDLQDLKDTHAKIGGLVATRAQGKSPRRSGALAGTLRNNRAVGRISVMAGRASVPYAGPIHWGWKARNIAAQPWIAQTAYETQPTWLRLYDQGIQKELDKVRGA